MSAAAPDASTTEFAPADAQIDTRRIGGVLMEVRNITLRFGGVVAIKDISFDIREGEIRAIIGPNGAGKSSMLNVINGFYIRRKARSGFAGRSAERCGRMRSRISGSRGPSRTSRSSRACRRSTTS